MAICKICNVSKHVSEYYGAQRECKECTKERVKLREQKLRLNPEFVESERKRGREKYHRLNYKGRYNPSPENKKEIMDRYNKKYPEKRKCKSRLGILKAKEGNNLHHWSYNLEHAKDIIELSIEDHNKVHRFLKYNQKTFMYKDLNGKLLYTKELHLKYINDVIKYF